MNKPGIGPALCAMILLAALWAAPARAQTAVWSEPYLLSTEGRRASDGYLAADQYGFVHAFWSELLEDHRSIIQYARFDGAAWSTPLDIYVSEPYVTIRNVSPVVDGQGTLHIAWAEGGIVDGPAYYSRAPAGNALSARSWEPPVRIDIPAGTLHLRIDSTGVYHILYINRTAESGVYYIRSADQGRSWSAPAWLDPDILPNHIPDSLSFDLDDADGLHAVWYYGAITQAARPDWVRYARSVDGGFTWPAPLLLDQYDQTSRHSLSAAGPRMIVQGRTVHVIWAAGALPYRYHRFSEDAGLTWSAPAQIFGELHGQAGDGLTIDGAGRVHFLGQIRYPVGIYHAYWEQGQWTPPSLVYLIAQGDITEEIVAQRIHAHGLQLAMRAGNQLILAFGDGPAEPNRRLFVVQRTLGDIPPLVTVSTPTPTATPIPTPSRTPEPPAPIQTTPTPTPQFDASAAPPPGPVPGPEMVLQLSLLPTLIFLGSALALRLLVKPWRWLPWSERRALPPGAQRAERMAGGGSGRRQR